VRAGVSGEERDEAGLPGYRLVGAVEGERWVRPLVPGENLVGERPECKVHLPARGVSRRHALLRWGRAGLVVEDLQSKNGTFVNGERVERSAVRPGDELRFGPVALRLEAVHPGDTVLALTLAPGTDPGPWTDPEATDWLSDPVHHEVAAARLEALEELIELLAGDGEPDLGGALRLVAELSGATGCALLAWEKGGAEPRVRALWGAVRDLSRSVEVQELLYRVLEPGEPEESWGAKRFGEPGASERLGESERSKGFEEPGRANKSEQSGESRRSGELGKLGRPEQARGSAAGERPFFHTVRLAGEPPAWCCAWRRQDGPAALAGLVFGSPAGERELAALLGILARLLGRFRLGPPPGSRRRRQGSEAGALATPEGFVRGSSAAMQAVYLQLEQVSRADFPVLVVGETGVGKEHLVRLLYAGSDRRLGPFVAINCAAIPAELLESEMFGVERGVATGVSERKGRFQEAAGGVLFLDEIADLPLPLQAKLLRALEDRTVQPLGGALEPVDVRIVAATNADLRRRAETGEFRADLYYRIAGYILRVPPLRERREDIGPLVQHFLARSAREAGRWVSGVTLKALELLTRYGWPGNLRELEQEVRRLVYVCPEGEPIDSSLLSAVIRDLAVPEGVAGSAAGGSAPESGDLALDLRLEELERSLIWRALRAAGGSQSQAARLLGLSRNGLAKKLRRYGIDPREAATARNLPTA
jgi:DNA-binding NtrC family response regulator/transcriptional regulator with XRE-family HTH domain